MKTQRLSLILSSLALVVALTGVTLVQAGVIITSKQIRNGTIVTQDIHKGGVQGSDVKDGAVASADLGTGAVTSPDIAGGAVGSPAIGEGAVQTGDIGANQVTPADVALPPPAADTEGPISGPVTTAGFTKLATVYTYAKVQAESSLEVSWSGAVTSGSGTNCVFQLRVNGAAPAAGGGEVFATTSAANVSTTALFTGQPVGSADIEVWAKAASAISTEPSCVVGPANPGIVSSFVIAEAVV